MKTDSILKGWSSDIAFVRTCIAGAITRSKMAGKGIEQSELREAVWEASKGGPPRYLCKYTECANERPSFLVCVMLHLKSMLGDRPLRIFDAAAGWGDRLIAAMVVDAARYVGVDPNSNSKPCFLAAVEAIKGREGHAKYEVLCDGCPGVVLPPDCDDGSMNVAFLSPPAFDSEFYSDDVSALVCDDRGCLVCELCTGGPKRQRVPRPRGLAGALCSDPAASDTRLLFKQSMVCLILCGLQVKFLFATIDKCWALLQPGGFLVIQSMLCKVPTFQ